MPQSILTTSNLSLLKNNLQPPYKLPSSFFLLSTQLQQWIWTLYIKTSSWLSLVTQLLQNISLQIVITKDHSCKQIIILIGSNNVKRLMAQSNIYVTNINRSLKEIKLEVVVDFIRSDNKDIIVNLSDVMSSRLLQSKLYLKILDISYFVEDTNLFFDF